MKSAEKLNNAYHAAFFSRLSREDASGNWVYMLTSNVEGVASLAYCSILRDLPDWVPHLRSSSPYVEIFSLRSEQYTDVIGNTIDELKRDTNQALFGALSGDWLDEHLVLRNMGDLKLTCLDVHIPLEGNFPDGLIKHLTDQFERSRRKNEDLLMQAGIQRKTLASIDAEFEIDAINEFVLSRSPKWRELLFPVLRNALVNAFNAFNKDVRGHAGNMNMFNTGVVHTLSDVTASELSLPLDLTINTTSYTGKNPVMFERVLKQVGSDLKDTLRPFAETLPALDKPGVDSSEFHGTVPSLIGDMPISHRLDDDLSHGTFTGLMATEDASTPFELLVGVITRHLWALTVARQSWIVDNAYREAVPPSQDAIKEVLSRKEANFSSSEDFWRSLIGATIEQANMALLDTPLFENVPDPIITQGEYA